MVSTIGFPLVGGPAGTMEGGRQAEVAKVRARVWGGGEGGRGKGGGGRGSMHD